MPGITRINT